jgi:hypothetical protein
MIAPPPARVRQTDVTSKRERVRRGTKGAVRIGGRWVAPCEIVSAYLVVFVKAVMAVLSLLSMRHAWPMPSSPLVDSCRVAREGEAGLADGRSQSKAGDQYG